MFLCNLCNTGEGQVGSSGLGYSSLLNSSHSNYFILSLQNVSDFGADRDIRMEFSAARSSLTGSGLSSFNKSFRDCGHWPEGPESRVARKFERPLWKVTGGNIFKGYADPGGQCFGHARCFHRDHSSVSGLAAEDLNKARETKKDNSKPHKQMVHFLLCFHHPPSHHLVLLHTSQQNFIFLKYIL